MKGVIQLFSTIFRGESRNLWWAVFYFLIKNSPVWLMPFVLMNLIDAVAEPSENTMEEVTLNGLILLVFILQNILSHTVYAHYLSRAVRGMQRRLRQSLVQRLQQLSIGFHLNQHSGKIQAKVLRDVDLLENLSRQSYDIVLPGLLTIIIGVITALQLNVYLGLVFLVSVPVSVGLVRLFRSRIQVEAEGYRRENEMMSSMVSEMIHMIPVTRASSAEHVEIQKVGGQLDRLLDKGRRLDVINAVFGSLCWVGFQLVQLLVILSGCYMVYLGEITVGSIMLFHGYFSQVVNSVSQILNIYPMACQGFEAVKSIQEILHNDELEEHDNKQRIETIYGHVRFENVCFRYEDEQEDVIRSINMDIPQGQCVALIGESGSGKSTLMQLLIGFYKPTQGRILLDGNDLSTLNLRDFRKHLSVVGQNTLLFSGSVYENLTYGLQDVSESKLYEAMESAQIREFVERLPQGLETKLGENGAKLSGGQRQRLAIARALLRDPKMIILDEATSALDVSSEKKVQEALDYLIKGRTTFIIAHRLSTIRNAEHIVVMKGGCCVEQGTAEELLKHQGEFFRLRNLQI